MPTSLLPQADRMRGAIYGALVGDALGVPVEFTTREQRDIKPVVSMRGFGTWQQPPGTWSDDGALLLCSAEALLDGYSPARMADGFVRWISKGHWSAHGEVFDIGNGTRTAIRRLAGGIEPEQAGGADQNDNGNGSLMRILPVALRFADRPAATVAEVAARASRLTHAHPRSSLACAIYCVVAARLLDGAQPNDAIRQTATFIRNWSGTPVAELAHFDRALNPELGALPCHEIASGGYVVETLEAALWCLLTTTNYQQAVLAAVNLGADTDTTGCVAGGLAGILYGERAIPLQWGSQLPRQEELGQLVTRFVAQCINNGSAS